MRGRCNSRSISGALIFKEKGLLALRQSQQSDKGWRVMLYDLSRWHGYLLLEGWQRGEAHQEARNNRERNIP
jgi:hypothetical protein